MKRYFKFVLLLGICFIFLTGCIVDLVIPENDINSPATEDNSNYENPVGELDTGKGTLKIYLTDAPGDYKEVNINISRIEGHIAGDEEEGEDKGSWEVLKDWKGGLPVNLIELEDVSMILASLELEPNKYTQLRLFLMSGEEDAWVVLNDLGLTEVPLEIPSVYQTGIKLNRPFEILEDMITKLTIDFDAEKSVIKTGNGKFKMKPVISVTSSTYSPVNVPGGVGSVSGSVSYYKSDEGVLALAGIGGANIELTGGAYIFANTTTTLEDGSFSFGLDNVPAGSYTLNVYAENYDNYSESIEVITGSNTEVNVVLLSGGISGVVVDSEDDLPIGGATVSVTLSSGDIFNSSAITNGSGEFVIEQLPVGFYALTVSANDYDLYLHAVEIEVTEGVINNIEDEIELIPSTS